MTAFDTLTGMWSAALADTTKQWQDFATKAASWPNVIETAEKVRVAITPSEPIYKEDKLRLLHYRDGVEQAFDTPLLFIFALVNRPYILDLKEGKTVVGHFVRRGFDTYNIDWGVPSDGDRYLDMEDYIERYVHHCVERVCERTGQDKINILGYCMGGSMSAMYASLHPERVKNLILMAAPVDWSSQEHHLALWTRPEYFDVDKFIEVYGNAPAEWLQWSFLLLRPVDNLFSKYVNFYNNMEDEKYLEDFFAMERWLNDNIPVAGEMFRQFVKHCMQKNELIQGKLIIGDRRVDLRNITCPILNLTASNDHLVPCGQSLPFNNAVGSTDKEAITFPAGHIGLAVGSKAHRDMWPRVVEWLAKRSGGRGS